MNTLDKLFADALHAKRPATKKPVAPIDPLVKLQKALDELSAASGTERCDLSKAVATAPARRPEIVLKQTARRDYAFHKATGDESLGTRSARDIAGGDNIVKAAREDAIVLHGGFVSRSDLTGQK